MERDQRRTHWRHKIYSHGGLLDRYEKRRRQKAKSASMGQFKLHVHCYPRGPFKYREWPSAVIDFVIPMRELLLDHLAHLASHRNPNPLLLKHLDWKKFLARLETRVFVTRKWDQIGYGCFTDSDGDSLDLYYTTGDIRKVESFKEIAKLHRHMDTDAYDLRYLYRMDIDVYLTSLNKKKGGFRMPGITAWQTWGKQALQFRLAQASESDDNPARDDIRIVTIDPADFDDSQSIGHESLPADDEQPIEDDSDGYDLDLDSAYGQWLWKKETRQGSA